jgi:hypothetical protein
MSVDDGKGNGGVLVEPGNTHLGGRSMNVPPALAVGGDGGIFVAGQTDSTDFPLAPAGAPLDGARGGTDDAFVLKIGAALDDAPTVTPVATLATGVPATEEATPTPTGEATPMSTATEIMPSATSTPTQSTQTPTVEGTPTVQRTPTVRPTNTMRPSETATAVATGTVEPASRVIWLPVVYWE